MAKGRTRRAVARRLKKWRAKDFESEEESCEKKDRSKVLEDEGSSYDAANKDALEDEAGSSDAANKDANHSRSEGEEKEVVQSEAKADGFDAADKQAHVYDADKEHDIVAGSRHVDSETYGKEADQTLADAEADVVSQLKRLGLNELDCRAVDGVDIKIQQAQNIDDTGTSAKPTDGSTKIEPMPQATTTRKAQTGVTWSQHPEWRNRRPDTGQVRHGGACTMGTFRIPGERTLRGDRVSDQKPGAIIWRNDRRRYPGPKTPEDDFTILVDKNGQKWQTKGRYWLIIKVDGDYIFEIPIYTNHNAGLRSTHRKLWHEYFSIKPLHVDAKKFKNQSPENEVLEVNWMKSDPAGRVGMFVRNTMVAHWKDVKRRYYRVDELRIVGSISDACTKIACERALGETDA